MPPNSINRAIAAAVAAAIVSSAANASPSVTVSEDFALSDAVSSSASTQANFSIAALLAETGLANPELTSLEVTAYGYSSPVFNSNSSNYAGTNTTLTANDSYSYSYSYSCGSWGWSTCYQSVYVPILYYNQTTSYNNTSEDNIVDFINVNLGGASASGNDSFATDYTTYSTYETGTSNNGTEGYTADYNSVTTTYNGYYGALQASVAAPVSDLLNIGTTKQVSVTIGDTGNSLVTSDVNVHLTAIEKPAAPIKVPEPGITTLLGAGLMGLAVAWRRRTRA
jgi:hypothetical protein